MKLTLSLDAQKLVEDKVASGRYRSIEEVVHTAIYVLDQRDQEEAHVEQLRGDLQKAQDQFGRGEYRSFASAGELLVEVRGRALSQRVQ